VAKCLRYLAIVAALVALPFAATGAFAAEPAKNIIIMVADGAAWNTWDMTSYYQYGVLGSQPYDAFPIKYAMTTFPLNTSSLPTGNSTPQVSYDPVKAWSTAPDETYGYAGYSYLRKNTTDSGAVATAFGTGQKTYTGAINWANSPATTGAPLPTIAEIAKAKGQSVGVVTSVEWVHATPAALGAAHNIDRYDYLGIGNEMLGSGTLDVIMGAGNPNFDMYGAPQAPDYKYAGGEANWTAIANGTHPGGWSLVQTVQEFQALTTGPAPARVLGAAQNRHTLQQERLPTHDWNGDGSITAADAVAAPAFGEPNLATVPTLEIMTKGALNVLGQKGTGFFLAIEGGAVDWAASAKQTGYAIEEQIDFNRSVQAVTDWVNANSNWNETLLIVTADHNTGQPMGPRSQLLPPNTNALPFAPIENNGAGNMPGVYWESSSHASALVPVFAKGAGADLFTGMVDGVDPVYGQYVDNTDVFRVMYGAMHSPATLRWTGAVDQKWNTGLTLNWAMAGAPQAYVDGDHVIFDDTGAPLAQVDITTTVRPGSALVNNSATTVALGGSGSIAGPCGLTKAGDGMLTLSNSNGYTGGTMVAAGTLLVENTAGSATGSGTVWVGAAILGGTGFINGPVVLTGDSTLTSSGTLTINDMLTVLGEGNQIAGGTVLTTGDVTIEPGAVFIINGTLGGDTGELIVRGTLMGKGTINKSLSLEAGGVLSPGAPSTIQGMAQILSAEAPRNFSFEIGAATPNYAVPSNSINDVIRLTDTATPFADATGAAPAALTADTVIDVYFLSADPAAGEYKAEFFAAKNFSDAVAGATYQYWRLDPRGSRYHNGNFYSPLDESLVDWSVVPETATFNGLAASGYITQFTVAPEPATLALMLVGVAAMLARSSPRREPRGRFARG
jgi:alkaline phosphatase